MFAIAMPPQGGEIRFLFVSILLSAKTGKTLPFIQTDL